MQDRGYESFIFRKVRDNVTELFLNKTHCHWFREIGNFERIFINTRFPKQRDLFFNKRLRSDEHETAKRHCYVHLYGTSLRDPIPTDFTGTVPFSWVLNSPVSLSNKIRFGPTDVTGFFEVI